MIWLATSLVALAIGPEPREKPMTDVVRGNNAFALDLYGKIRAQAGNTFFSPYSISSALAMTQAGARGETAAEMARVLHFGPNTPAHQRDRTALMNSLNGGDADRAYRLEVANRLWGMKGFHFVPEFLQESKSASGAGLEEVDFARSAEAIQTINAWVEARTQDKIKNLLHPGDVDARTRLVLTNAIYFKGSWTVPFAKSATRDLPFHKTVTDAVPVPTMFHQADYALFEGDGLKALEMVYRPGDLAMDVLLPDAVDGLPALEAKLTPENLDRWIGGMQPKPVAVSLPKFTMTTRVELSPILVALGMKKAFQGSEADFSGIATEDRLAISAVIHQAFVAADEEGTEAAAATAVVMSRMSMNIPPKPPIVFRADHPFVFLIRDLRSGSILFLGRVTNPQG